MNGDAWRPLFSLGSIYATHGAIDALEERGLELTHYLARHALGDWGDVCREDAEANRQALTLGSRILSSYKLDDGQKLWIITEADRSATTLLLPEEY